MLQEEQPGSGTGEPKDVPLPATLTFVLLMGITFFVLWFGIFALLKARW